MSDLITELERAWSWREKRGVFSQSEASRIFHGPGEGGGSLQNLAIDRFGEFYWITQWEQKGVEIRAEIQEFLESKGALGAVALWRPEKGVPEEPEILFGHITESRFEVREGPAKFWIQLLKTRHPGLFLDHAPLRGWLRLRAQRCKVLNTFAYTGSLSVSAALGGADHVTSLDLSKPALQWAQENWALNGLDPERARFLSGNVFEWLPRMRREGELFDCVILDPPSFSRGREGTFSTSKDLERLHRMAMEVLAPGGIIVTSINSANVSIGKFESDLLTASSKARMRFQVLGQIGAPDTFPFLFGAPLSDRYLKGFILKRISY